MNLAVDRAAPEISGSALLQADIDAHMARPLFLWVSGSDPERCATIPDATNCSGQSVTLTIAWSKDSTTSPLCSYEQFTQTGDTYLDR
jgi:hypothetical protein